jgi:Zn-dependent protease
LPNQGKFVTTILIWAVPTILAIILHEVMHGFVALAFGDNTAQRAGRLTLNPIRHIDPFGTLIMPAILIFSHLPVFGYAKPVPVDFRNLRPQRLGMILVSAAGPLTNLSLAIVSAIALRSIDAGNGGGGGLLSAMLLASVLINVMLAVFNLFPLLPLDGGRVLAGLLPPELARSYARIERYGFLILFLLLYMTDWVDRIVDPIVTTVARALL